MKPGTTESNEWDPGWPCFLGGAGSIPAGAVVQHWLPQPIANGVGFCFAWMIVGVAFSFRPPAPKWTRWRWTLGGAIGAIVGATITFLMQK
jgi:hypothetical protein